jgi:hypothetical protein
VVIGDDVEIGANTCIDRGSYRDTTIGDGTKIDNLVPCRAQRPDRPGLPHHRGAELAGSVTSATGRGSPRTPASASTSTIGEGSR